MSANYVSGRYFIGTNKDGVFGDITDEFADDNYTFLQKLYDTNVSGDLEKYKVLFNEFISNKELFGYFSYTDHPASSCDRQFYPLCECSINEDSLIKIHRDYYEAECRCPNGKRYIALRNAYEIAAENSGCYVTFSIKELKKNSNADFENDPIIQWIESTGPVFYDYKEWIFTKE